MDVLAALKILFLGLIEGITEFLPISSTGHLVIAADWIGFPGQTGLTESTANAFLVFIQLGAILAIVCLYWRTFWGIARDFYRPGRSQRLLINLVIGTIPAVVVGLPTEDWIEKHFMKPIPVAAALVVGGIAILLVERFVKHASCGDVHDLSWRKALGVGCFQVLAILFPGMSRSASTILGGLSLGLSRKTATEFSFFLAVPAMCGASIIKLYSAREGLSAEAVPIFAFGFIAAFVSALVVVRWLLHYVAGHTFAAFAWYRIIFGVILLLVYTNGTTFPTLEANEPPVDPSEP